MATDLTQIVAEIAAFYDFSGKTVVVVGAGGGQLIDYLIPARYVIAIEEDAAALERLAKVVRERGVEDTFEFVHGEFLATRIFGDVVVLEFCLHEMKDATRAVGHAKTLATDVLVIDHAPGSPWSRYAAEEEGVEAAWAAVGRNVRGQRDVEALQRFSNFHELEERLARQPSISRVRIAALRDEQPITIPMPYRLVLIGGRTLAGRNTRRG